MLWQRIKWQVPQVLIVAVPLSLPLPHCPAPADGMGLGKTFQTIASLYSLLTKGVSGQPTCRKPLILCPTSLVQVSTGSCTRCLRATHPATCTSSFQGRVL
eukprot:GHRQ01037555.1.p2 GENE.GHRQ01037555.1~~GHRQ01037555.1.p2  ORF type:complete len:101 (+),score=15.41 GHRQ01037555.1:119-421(+)